MTVIRKLPDNVRLFLSGIAEDAGHRYAERFESDVYVDLIEKLSGSPIEDLFYIACRAHLDAWEIRCDPDPDLIDGQTIWPSGVRIAPQASVGKFRVDFMLHQIELGPNEIYTPVVVELDGHDFHDKDKRQRSYEKARDRFLVKSGYKVLHYTGSDVVADPYKVAFEALSLAGAFTGSGRDDEYDASNPLGID